MLLSKELLQKVRLIEITTRKVVDDVLTGQYRSHFKGSGVQFSEHRPYVPGDDVRHIDWRVSARSRDPQIKKYDEERELIVFLVVDVSGSENFGSQGKLKSEIVAEIGGMLAYAATHTGDRVGVLMFAGEVEYIVPPKKGRKHVLRLIRDLLAYSPKTKGTDLEGALEAADRIMKHRGIIFILSDFIAEGYSRQLMRLASKHDVVAVQIKDQRESDIPDVGQLLMCNPETGEEVLVDTGSYQFRKWFDEYRSRVEADSKATVRTGVERLQIVTEEDYTDTVVRFFRARSRRRKLR